MPDSTPNIDIIRTKLHRPPLPPDIVPRPHLLEQLERGRQRSLTLVSAPAGYGKSTLVSQWLDESGAPSAWLSLDPEDSDLRRFLRYVVTAMQSLIPEFGQDTLSVLELLDLPSWDVPAHTLLNELNALQEACVLVLDDYHRIHNTEIHSVLRRLLSHPLPSVHLVLIARHDPPLPLARLRAQDRLTEIRGPELRFSPQETQLLLRQMTGLPIDERTAAVLDEKIEGWITGLRLAMLSLRNGTEIERLLAHLPEENQYITDYLFEEVFSQQPEAIRHCLMRTAILERFCAPLCSTLFQESGQDASLKDGQEFLSYLAQQGLFTVELDERHSWFRYHHLFQTFLQRRLRTQHSPQEIADLHRRAMRWFESQGLIDEALQQALAAEDLPAALELVAQHREGLMNEEQWPRLASWLSLFPYDIVKQTPDLLILKAWLAYHRTSLAEIAAELERFNACRDTMPTDASRQKRLRGEYTALRSYLHFMNSDDGETRASARMALQMLPEESLYARSLAMMMLSLALQMLGKLHEATELVYQTLQHEAFKRTSHHTRMLTTLCFVHWMEADLPGIEQIAAQNLALSQDLGLGECMVSSQYFSGSCHYLRNRLAEAEKHFSVSIRPGERLTARHLIFSVVALALTHLAQGNPSAAHELIDRLLAESLEEGKAIVLRYARTFKAELTLRQGQVKAAAALMRHVTPPPLYVLTRIYLPQLTPVKIRIAQAGAENLREAASQLEELREYHERIHNTPALIEVLAVQALLEEAQGERTSALSTLAQALHLAEAGDLLRLFVDIGAELAPLLKACAQEEPELRDYAARLLKALDEEELRTTGGKGEVLRPSSPATSTQNGRIEALTNRELDVLELLAQRYRNKEIAERLCISPRTVKRHLYSLYQKLDVHRRREAVAKAIELKLIS